MRPLPGDTIAAISTSLGPGAIAIVRLSGAGSLEIADRIFRGRRQLVGAPSHTVYHGHVVDPGGSAVDEVLATVMLAPHTYTTEHIIEFGCHGGPVPARRVLAACLAAGARLARRGEFTERAFLGGRLDLVQAEAVADMVAASTRRGLELALGQLGGKLSAKLASLRETLLAVRTELEAAIDFEEDVDEDAAVAEASRLTSEAAAEVDALLAGCDRGAAVRDGVSVAIVGRPNVGKSSLMNALLMRDRSIVTSMPGTTRDVIEEVLHLSGVPVRLVDTAGWREAADEAEAAGVERARTAASGADYTLLIVDATQPGAEEDAAIAEELGGGPSLVVENKIDLTVPGTQRPGGAADVEPDLRVSAVRGDGLDELRDVLARMCAGGDDEVEPSVTNVRHVDALIRVRAALEATGELLATGGQPELAAGELAAATDALGEITGETTPEDVLRHIFDRFCVGK